MGSYVPSTQAQREQMLRAVGLENIMDLYRDVPEQMLLRKPLNIPDGMSELEASRAVSAMAAENRTYATVLRGAGAYDHYIPSIVKYIPAKEEFLTAYTPYQAEMSQGLLQSIFEYQTMICELTGMDVSNASVYDGATAAAEAAAMCRERKRRVTLISGAAHPDTINTAPIATAPATSCGWCRPRTAKPTWRPWPPCWMRRLPPSTSSSPTSSACLRTPRPWASWCTRRAPSISWAATPLPWPL